MRVAVVRTSHGDGGDKSASARVSKRLLVDDDYCRYDCRKDALSKVERVGSDECDKLTRSKPAMPKQKPAARARTA